MVEIALISDRDSLKAWLDVQPREVAVAIAARAALRVVPVCWREFQINEAVRTRGLTASSFLRLVFILSVAPRSPSDKLSGAVSAAYASALSAPTVSGGAASAAASATASANSFLAPITSTTASKAADACDAASVVWTDDVGAFAGGKLWHEVRADAVRFSAEEAESGSGLYTVATTSFGKFSVEIELGLWAHIQNPFDKIWQAIKDHEERERKPNSGKSFWIAWYQSLLDGKPMLGDAARTQEMLEKIALIDPKLWNQGEDVVTPLIDEIWELYRLRVEVAALRAERDGFLAHGASAEHRSHNHPPELIDATKEIAQRTEIIWTVLDEAQAELEENAPDKSRLRRIADILLKALKSVAEYCRKVANVYVLSVAVAGGPATVDQIVNNGRLWQFAKDLLSFSGGP